MGKSISKTPVSKEKYVTEAVFEKHIGSIAESFHSVDERFDSVDKRFESVDKRFDKIDSRLDKHDQLFDVIITKLTSVDLNLKRFIKRNESDMSLLTTRVEKLEAKIK